MTSPSDTQRTPDELTAENELICEKLLGWKPCSRHVVHGWMEWAVEPGPKFYRTPTFDSWREAGLILVAMQITMHRPDLLAELADKLAEGVMTPSEIRAAAVEYVRSLP